MLSDAHRLGVEEPESDDDDKWTPRHPWLGNRQPLCDDRTVQRNLRWGGRLKYARPNVCQNTTVAGIK